jgi:hypothetical protein
MKYDNSEIYEKFEWIPTPHTGKTSIWSPFCIYINDYYLNTNSLKEA